MLAFSPLFFFFFVFSSQFLAIFSATFTLSNKCSQTIWPGILSNAGSTPLASTGFALEPGDSRSLDAPAPWSGRFWARTLCSTDPSGKFSCATGDCGSGKIECSGGGAAPPATLAEITLAGGEDRRTDFYDVSLVDGYNLPVLLEASGGSGGCGSTGCAVDLNGGCPAELKVGGGVACKSACEAFRTEEYCCSGEHGNPNTCSPTPYSEYFKNACPKAYSYAYDDRTSTFTCESAEAYVITFCPGSSTSAKSSGKHTGSGLRPLLDDMEFLTIRSSRAAPTRSTTVLLPFAAMAVASWGLSSPTLVKL